MKFPRQEYWSGLPFPSLAYLSNPWIKPASLTLAGRFLTTEPPGKLYFITYIPSYFSSGDPVNFVGSTVSKLPITCVEARMGAVVSLAWVHLTIFLTSLRFICFISKNTCYKAQVTRLLWRLHNMMLLAQSWREWSSLNICSLFVITLPESELVWWWWLRLVPFNGTPLQYSCLENPWMEEPGGL